MNTLVLKNKFKSNATLLTNEFIDQYMPKANGEFVKVYLFLLRHIDNLDSCISIPAIADQLNNTETDIIRAIKYWESQGLLSLGWDHDENIVNLELFETPVFHPKALPALYNNGKASQVAPTLYHNDKASQLSPALYHHDKAPQGDAPIPFEPYKAKKSAEELKTVLHFTELYLGKPISSTEAESIIYLYEDLDMSSDLIEYLVGTCVDNDNKSIAYINKVALDWHDKGIRTVKEAKVESRKYSKIYSSVINTFGIINRGLAKQEINYIDKWTNQYNFPIEIIEEACDKTIFHTSQPSFKYADSILKGWYKNNVSTIEDIKLLDKQHLENNSNNKETPQKRNVKSSSRASSKTKEDFEKRDFDYDSFAEEQIKARIAARQSQ
jgi:DnaD/phage-associated family protein